MAWETLVSVGVVILGALLNAAVTWGVLTERLAAVREKAERAQASADKAHERLDTLHDSRA